MKNLFKKLLASCLVVCMVLTLCVGAITVNAENPTGTVVAGEVTVDSGEGTAVVPVEVSAGVAASKVSVKVPANLTITALTLDTADEDVDVTYASAAAPNGKPISLVEATEFVAPYVDAEGVFSYIIHAPAGEVTTAPVIVKISFTGTFVENAEGILVDVEAQAAPDAVVLFDLTITDGKIIVKAAHVCAAARTEQENVNQATCYAEGSYDEVVYCTCGKELSRTPKTIDKIAHTPAEAVVENNKAATCYAKGSYESVVYCSVEACKFEISRISVPVDETEHTPATAVVENEVAATCLAAGSYESVVYCSVAECKHEISRTTIPVEALKHDYTYKNDGDTHSATCPNGCAGITGEAHNFVDDKCVCGAVEEPDVKCEHEWVVTEATAATANGPAGVLKMSCSVCHESVDASVTNNSYYSLWVPSAAFEDEILINFKAVTQWMPTEYDEFIVVFEKEVFEGDPRYSVKAGTSGVPSTNINVGGSKPSTSWSFPIAAKEMNDSITATIFVLNDGVWYSGRSLTKSFVDYATELFGGNYTESLKGFLANAMYYGGKAQINFKYDVENPAYNHIPAEYENLVNKEVPEIGGKVNGSYTSGDVIFRRTSSMSAESKTEMNHKVLLMDSSLDLSKLTIEAKFTKADGTESVTTIVYNEVASKEKIDASEVFYYDGVESNRNRYKIVYAGIAAKEMRKLVTFTAYYDGVPAATPFTCTMESLAADIMTKNPDEVALHEMFYAMLNYGDAAEAYFK